MPGPQFLAEFLAQFLAQFLASLPSPPLSWRHRDGWSIRRVAALADKAFVRDRGAPLIGSVTVGSQRKCAGHRLDT